MTEENIVILIVDAIELDTFDGAMPPHIKNGLITKLLSDAVISDAFWEFGHSRWSEGYDAAYSSIRERYD